MKIGAIDLGLFQFRGGLVSDWLEPNKFVWTYKTPSKRTKGKFNNVEMAKVGDYGATKLWTRAMLQPIAGPKMKLIIGVAPVDDMKTIPSTTTRPSPCSRSGMPTCSSSLLTTWGSVSGLSRTSSTLMKKKTTIW